MSQVEQVERAGGPAEVAPSRADIIAQAKEVSPAARAQLILAEQAAARDPRIGELPIEVYQAVLESRAQSDKEFFESWGRSIAENAAADKRAHLLYEQAKGQETRVMHSAQLLVQQMRDAQRRGRLDMGTVNAIHTQHGKVIIDAMSGRMPAAPRTPGAPRPVGASPAGLRVTQGPVPDRHAPANALVPPSRRGVPT